MDNLCMNILFTMLQSFADACNNFLAETLFFLMPFPSFHLILLFILLLQLLLLLLLLFLLLFFLLLLLLLLSQPPRTCILLCPKMSRKLIPYYFLSLSLSLWYSPILFLSVCGCYYKHHY